MVRWFSHCKLLWVALKENYLSCSLVSGLVRFGQDVLGVLLDSVNPGRSVILRAVCISSGTNRAIWNWLTPLVRYGVGVCLCVICIATIRNFIYDCYCNLVLTTKTTQTHDTLLIDVFFFCIYSFELSHLSQRRCAYRPAQLMSFVWLDFICWSVPLAETDWVSHRPAPIPDAIEHHCLNGGRFTLMDCAIFKRFL